MALGAALLVAVGITACGGGLPASSVAVVNGKSITKTTFDHWLGVTSASRTASTKSKTATKPVIPEPPRYTACIARLRENEAKPAKGASRKSESTLKSGCAEYYKAAKDEAIGFLIAAEWLLEEAAERKVSVSEKTVDATLAKDKKADYPKESEFKELLTRSGMTVSNIALRLKLEMLSKKIEEAVLKPAKKTPSKAEVAKYYEAHKSDYGKKSLKSVEAEVKQALITEHEQSAYTKFTESFKKKWKAKTECRAGYVIEDCKNYKKPKTTKSSTSATSTASK